MPPTETFLVFTRRFGELGVRYMVSGSIAAVYYGEPRLTNDVDVVAWLKRDGVTRFKGAFPGDEFYCPPEDVVLIEIGRRQRGHFNLIHHQTGFKGIGNWESGSGRVPIIVPSPLIPKPCHAELITCRFSK